MLAAALAALAGAPARATLGGPIASVETDRQQIRATTRITAHAAFAVHELRNAGGDVVHEYVAPSGAVFAISWGGTTLPNLRQLLGIHFDTYVNSTHRQRGGRGHLVVRDRNLVVESTGHMRAFRGRAYLTDAFPTGVTVDDIK